MSDLISRQAAVEALEAKKDKSAKGDMGCFYNTIIQNDIDALKGLPSAQPFHNITMNDVLEYIDGMPEDVWQEFTACLECRGWDLQRRVAKWCGGEFA